MFGAWDAGRDNLNCHGPQGPRNSGPQRFPVGGDLVNPRLFVFPLLPTASPHNGFQPSYEGSTCLNGTAGEEFGQQNRRETHPISVGLMGQVALCRPYPPSSHIGVVERPGWQPRGLPDLSNFD